MQPWPGEVLEERAGEIAVAFAALLNRHAAWRHRRVETITVLSANIHHGTAEAEALVELVDRGDLHLVAPPTREGEAVALEAVAGVRAQDDVGGGVVGIGIHRVRPVEMPGRREPDVGRLQRNDGGQA